MRDHPTDRDLLPIDLPDENLSPRDLCIGSLRMIVGCLAVVGIVLVIVAIGLIVGWGRALAAWSIVVLIVLISIIATLSLWNSNSRLARITRWWI